MEIDAFYGIPILQKSFFWDGNGDTDVAGGRVHAFHFVDDHVALGVGLNATNWFVPGADVHSGEAEGVLRWYPIRAPRVFWDVHGGYAQATDPVPPGGTEWNFTFGFGPGVEVPLDTPTSLMLGVDYHHTSNALGRENSRNPSQNEARIWLGLGWTF